MNIQEYFIVNVINEYDDVWETLQHQFTKYEEAVEYISSHIQEGEAYRIDKLFTLAG